MELSNFNNSIISSKFLFKQKYYYFNIIQEIPAFSSYYDLNKTQSCSAEIAVIANSSSLFSNNDFQSLLAFDGDGEINSNSKSLFNFENIKFIIQNADNLNNINQ